MLEALARDIVILVACLLIFLGFGGLHLKIDPDSDPLKPTFQISRSWYTSMPADVGYVGVKVKEGNKWKDVWVLINKTLGVYPPLTEIKYGVVPKGLNNFIPPKNLQVGRVYQFAVYLAGYNERVAFTVMEKDGKPVIHVLDKMPI